MESIFRDTVSQSVSQSVSQYLENSEPFPGLLFIYSLALTKHEFNQRFLLVMTDDHGPIQCVRGIQYTSSQ